MGRPANLLRGLQPVTKHSQASCATRERHVENTVWSCTGANSALTGALPLQRHCGQARAGIKFNGREGGYCPPDPRRSKFLNPSARSIPRAIFSRVPAWPYACTRLFRWPRHSGVQLQAHWLVHDKTSRLSGANLTSTSWIQSLWRRN